ncbi:MAG: heavy metal translocating P-type ATPase [Patescibacteria group bacterium]|nr:heavy metal translocating P-type ATPase [Patescibacteria group bacterium]MDE1988124.1 heavy metal translocating P-type ATPase [Patescibacteria group bacterium]MDE2218222.1 heavy metal translocating P-type ATPase [Patescibacteria group bacterium]
MHPEIISDKSGMCSECGMALVPMRKKKSGGHSGHKESGSENFDKHSGHSVNIFRAKFWVSFALSVPVVAYSDIAEKLLNYTAPRFFGSQYIPLTLSSVIFFYGGSVFIISAYRELRAKLPGMMTLIALAISVAYFYSVAVTFLGGKDALFWELATLITIMLLGHWIEMRAVSGAQSALKELSKLLPDTAEVARNGKVEVVSLSEIKKGDLVLVKPGGRIPADGRVKEGISDVDESIATGESKPVSKKEGDEIIAGTINGDGSLKILVTKIGEETFLAGVMRLVAEAHSSKSRLQMLSDRAAFYLTIIAVATGGITLATWLALADSAFAVNRMVAVLVIACPHALGLAIPLVASISTTKAARNGFLIKQRMALEAARNIDVVLFDKTGTLTKGELGVDSIIPASETSEEEILRIAASVDKESEHPIALAIVNEAKRKNLTLSSAGNFQRIAGKGAKAAIDGREIFVGSEALLGERNLFLDGGTQKKISELSSQGKTIIFVLTAKKIIGAIALADIIREESREAIKTLHNLGIKTAMVTGDSEDVAKWVASKLDIDEYFARVLPDQKSEKVKLLQAKNQKVAMVGDGVNDAPALTQADLGVAIGAGTNVAIESAGIILVRNDPRDIAKIIRLSKLTYSKMIQNLFWATGYNVIAIPLAAGVLASKGVMLQPALAAGFMSVSTVIVALNALLLRRKKI